MRTVNLAPEWMRLARIVLDDLKKSDLPTKDFAIVLLTNACEKLDDLNERAERHNFVELDNEKLAIVVAVLAITMLQIERRPRTQYLR